MRLEAERRELAAAARRLRPDGLAVGTAGNLSVRAGDVVAVTPSAVAYDRLAPADVCVVDLDGGVVDGDRTPTSELAMHLAVYRGSDAGAVVHTHPLYATAASTVLAELPAIHYTIADLGGPVPVVPYAPPGSRALAERVAAALAGRSAVLLANHGALTVGPTLGRAYARSVLLEWLAATFHHARQLGEPALLGEAELAEVARRLEGYFDGAGAG